VTTTLTYDGTLSSVHIAVTGLNVIADRATVERSTNQVTWSFVRGGDNIIPTSQSFTLDDYEFSPNVLNYYRVRAYDTAPTTFVTGMPGTAGNNASVVPMTPSGQQAGDLMLIEASIRNSPTGQPVVPAGYTTVLDAVNLKLFGRIITGAESMPTITFTGGVANATTLAMPALFRNASLIVGNSSNQLNESQQNIPRAPLSVPEDNMLIIFAGWKQDDWTTCTPGPIPFLPTVDNGVSSTLGDDAAMIMSWQVQTTKFDFGPTTAGVTGGAAAISRWGAAAFYHQDLLTDDSIASITPTIDSVWMKDIGRPFLNRPLDCIPNMSSITRRARNGIFPIVGRSYPIAVTDLRMSREFTIEIITQTTAEREEFDIVLASGDVYFFQSPPGDPMPTMYAAVGDTDERRPLRNRTCGNDWRVFTLPLTEIAAPTSAIVGNVGTWQTVVNTYATWADVMAAHADWASLLTLVGTIDDIIVP